MITNPTIIKQGGGSLPSSSGSFTFATDTSCTSYDISHTLGEVPKGIIVWSDDLSAGSDVSAIYLQWAFWLDLPFATEKTASYAVSRIRSGGSCVGSAGDTNAWGNSETFKISFATNYKAGCTYKWVAWV